MAYTLLKHQLKHRVPEPLRAHMRTAKQGVLERIWAVEGLARWAVMRETLDRTPPLVIGGTGGSGTRVVARIAEGLGLFMGRHLDRQYDASTLFPFFATWNHALDAVQPPRSPATLLTMRCQLEQALLVHRRGIPQQAAAWGFKIPRSIFLLRFLASRFPAMRFLHMVRDGRDMAFSQNQFQLEVSGAIYLPELSERLRDAPRPVRSIALWSAANLAVARYGAAGLGSRYLRVRFEDLCADPAQTIATIAAFLGRPVGDPAGLSAIVEQPPSIGRWRSQEARLIAQICAEGADGLREFGYG